MFTHYTDAVAPKPLKYAYLLLAAVFLVNMIWIITTRISLDWYHIPDEIMPLIVFTASYYTITKLRVFKERPVLRKYLGALFYGLIFLQLAWINMRVLNHLTMTTAFPYVDSLLLRWDQMIGFDWLWYFETIHDMPTLLHILDLSYTSLTPLSVLVFCMLVATGYINRSYFFIEVFFFTAIITTIIGLFFPAEAGVATLIPDISIYKNFDGYPGLYHMKYFEFLRQPSGEILLDPRQLPGLVTFPSFHTSAGIILCIVTFRTWLFPIAFVYVALMIASTPIFGGHYIIDLIAGTILAFAVAFALLRTERFLGVLTTNKVQLNERGTK